MNLLGRIVFGLSVCCLLVSGLATTQGYAQTLLSTEDTNTSAVNEIDQKAQEIDIAQSTERQLADRGLELERQNASLETEIVFLEREQTELQERVNSLTETISNFERQLQNQPPETSNDLRESLESTRTELDDVQSQLLDVETILTSHRSTIEANNQALERIAERRRELNEDAASNMSDLWLEIWRQISEVIYVILLGFVTWLVLRLIGVGVKRYVKRAWLRKFYLRSLRIIFFILLFSYVVFLFAGNIGAIITAFGFLSAGLAIALQDYIASIFAWIFIKAKNKYVVGDIIKIAGSQENFVGKVIRIELFRTLLEQRVGGLEDDMNKERPNGKVVSVPNNLLMREPVVNFTHNDSTIMHSMEIELTFSSDHLKALKVLNTMMDEYFSTEYYKDRGIKGDRYYHNVLMTIQSSGVGFSMWFPARVGTYRQVTQDLSLLVLDTLKQHKLELAYNSLMLYTPDQSKAK
jgi:small-conductance mechanosensitive channel